MVTNNITGIGAANGIGFKRRNSAGGNYISPNVLNALCGVWIADQNNNDSPTRNIIKNKLKDRGGDLEILNAAYKLNSGYGKYEEDFTSWASSTKTNTTNNKITVQQDFNKGWISYVVANGRNIPAFKVEVSGIPDGGILMYGGDIHTKVLSNGINELPERTEANAFGFKTKNTADWSKLTIEQIPSFQGALVTDGVNDSIVSQKTVQEMLGGSNEITVVSMSHQLTVNSNLGYGVTNVVPINVPIGIKNSIKEVGKTGIYGYTVNGETNIAIRNILGDKNDYSSSRVTNINTDKFSVISSYQASSIAWYWTFIANRVLTTDEINQVIAYYNLDKYVKPDIYYDVKKQGLSNDTPDADWYLKDFSGNGRDMQLYNFAKKLGSGVGKYEVDFTVFTNRTNVVSINDNKIVLKSGSSCVVPYANLTDIYRSWKGKVTFDSNDLTHNLSYDYREADGKEKHLIITKSGEYSFPACYKTEIREGTYGGFFNRGNSVVTIEQITDYEGALVFDAVEDYGQFVGDLGLKDYTVAVDRAYPSLKVNGVPIISGINGDTVTPFLFEFADNTSVVRPYSFGATTVLAPMELSRKISYQSTYIYDGAAINKGLHDNTGNGLTIGRFGINTQYANIALWSLLLFPYTLSEFLLERQLKRYKLGTLYPDMVEFRPIITGNIPYDAIEISQGSTVLYNKSINKTGIYLQEGSTVRVYIKPSGIDEVSKITINGVSYADLPINPNGYYYADFPITKSPQKISYVIDEYIRYEDIVQPYPFIIPIIDTDGKEYTYGDKIKVGTEIRGGINGNNLLPELYKLNGYFNFNGAYFSASNKHVIGKTNVFELTNAPTYLKANEPNCIADPQRLRIPNSSYKILGYIPDISGHGNHLKINNSAYAGMSGANGYVEDFTIWGIYGGMYGGVILTDSTIKTTSIFRPQDSWVAYKSANKTLNSFSVNITGIPKEGILKFRVNADTFIELSNGRNDLFFDNLLITVSSGFRITKGNNLDWSNLVIEQIGEYEGSFCLDGVDDYLTIPTLSHGAKQVLMKVNWQEINRISYDQRNGNNNAFAIYTSDEGEFAAYNARNNGETYIDGVLNSAVIASQLKDITHNITITNNNATNVDTISPIIGRSYAAVLYSKMALFTFMSFDDISSEEEIKELNDVVGIEGGYVESPDYYWDAYGKSNIQADDIDDGIRGIIHSKMSIFDKSITGLAAIEQTNADASVGRVYDRALNLKNFAFNKESGYNGNNGLVSDGVNDHLINTVIPAVTDFTVIAKRQFLNSTLQNNETFCLKGDKLYSGGVGNAFLMEYNYSNTNNVILFGGYNQYPLETSQISYITPTSYNGNNTIRGNGDDNVGLMIGKCNTIYWKGVFYKMMLYSKTIDMLSINMLKNLFERDELIDVKHPIFKNNEDNE